MGLALKQEAWHYTVMHVLLYGNLIFMTLDYLNLEIFIHKF